MDNNLINPSDISGKGVIGLPDLPGLSTLEMQKKFDELVTDVVIPKHNALVNELSDDYATKEDLLDEVYLSGAADMTKAVYDTDNDGVVDDAEKLAGKLPSYYATAAATAAAKSVADAAMPKSGGSFTGDTAAYAVNRTGSALRNAAVFDSTGTTAQSTDSLRFWRK